VPRPGGRLQLADIANGNEVPEEAVRDIDLWTAWIARGLPCAGRTEMMRQAGFVDVEIGELVDVFGGAGGEANARTFAVYGHAFLARRPD